MTAPRQDGEQVLVRFRTGTMEALKSVVLPGETRARVLVTAVESFIQLRRRQAALGEREPALSEAAYLAWLARGTLRMQARGTPLARLGTMLVAMGEVLRQASDDEDAGAAIERAVGAARAALSELPSSPQPGPG